MLRAGVRFNAPVKDLDAPFSCSKKSLEPDNKDGLVEQMQTPANGQSKIMPPGYARQPTRPVFIGEPGLWE
jgi:hypothetical protein